MTNVTKLSPAELRLILTDYFERRKRFVTEVTFTANAGTDCFDRPSGGPQFAGAEVTWSDTRPKPEPNPRTE